MFRSIDDRQTKVFSTDVVSIRGRREYQWILAKNRRIQARIHRFSRTTGAGSPVAVGLLTQ